MMAEEMMNEPTMEGQVDMAAAQETLMSSDPEIQGVLMSRITQMSPEELQALDSAVTPAVETALLKLLPELGELIAFLNDQGAEEPMPENMEAMDESGMPKEMGALGNM
tara:strand:+ start:1049 stop:1375 length:327 start_codon:yes stop_codon:yes gene_type:complete